MCVTGAGSAAPPHRGAAGQGLVGSVALPAGAATCLCVCAGTSSLLKAPFAAQGFCMHMLTLLLPQRCGHPVSTGKLAESSHISFTPASQHAFRESLEPHVCRTLWVSSRARQRRPRSRRRRRRVQRRSRRGVLSGDQCCRRCRLCNAPMPRRCTGGTLCERSPSSKPCSR